MSKSRGNVINPDDTIAENRRGCVPHVRDVHGRVRSGRIPWSTEGARGCRRFIRARLAPAGFLTDEEGVRHEMEGPGQRDD